MLQLAIRVQDVVRLQVGADEGSVLNFGEAEASGERDVVEVGEDYLQEGDYEAEDWYWEKVELLMCRNLVVTGIRRAEDENEEEICSSVEDKIANSVLDGKVGLKTFRDEEKR